MKPFTLTVDDPAMSARINDASIASPSTARRPEIVVDATASPQTIVFETASADGLSVKKTFSVEPTSYIIAFGAVGADGRPERLNPVIHWGPGLGDDIARAPPASFFSPSYNTPAQPIVYKDGSVERIAPDDVRLAGRARSVTPASTITTSRRMLLNDQNTQPFRVDYAPALVPQPDDPDDHRAATSATRCGSRRRRISRGSSLARRRSTI